MKHSHSPSLRRIKKRLTQLDKQQTALSDLIAQRTQARPGNVCKALFFAFFAPSLLRQEAVETRKLRFQLSRIETELEDIREEYGSELFESFFLEELQSLPDELFTPKTS